MKILFIALFLTISSLLQAQNEEIYARTRGYLNASLGEFRRNEEVVVFGNNVKLRSDSSTNSDVLALLKIGEKVTILDTSWKYNTYEYNGVDWLWYKVRYEDKIGFVIGGLLSQVTQTTGTDTYVTSFKKLNNDYFLIVRLVNEDVKYFENTMKFYENQDFSIQVLGNEGISNIKNMVVLSTRNYLSDTTKSYFFNDGRSLKKAIVLRHSEDGGSHLFLEQVTFPTDPEGKKDKIIYTLYRDELDKNFEPLVLQFTWKGEEIKPNQWIK